MSNGVSSILERYGTSLAETRKMLGELMPALQKKKTYPFLDTPQYFTSEEVKDLMLATDTGEPFELKEGWLLKATPSETGTIFSLKAPTGEEINLEDVFVTPEGEWLTRAQQETQLAEWKETIGTLSSKLFPEYESISLEDLSAYANENPEDFWERLQKVGRTPETEALLRMMGATEVDITDLLPLSSQDIALKPLSQMPLGSYVISAQPMEAIAAFAKSDFDSFRQAMLFEGRNEKTEALLKDSGWTDKQVNDFFLDNIPGKFVRGQWLPDALEDYWKLYWGGTGDMVGALAGVADRLGVDGVAEAMTQIGLEGRLITIDVEMGKPDSPEWYAKNITRMLPMMLAIIDAGIATGGGGAALVGAAGGGTFLSSIIGTISAGAVTTLGEGAMEAGDAYQEAQRRGFTDTEANAVFDEVLRGNAGLLSLTNTAQFGAGFFLPGGRTATFLAKALIFGFEATSEGLEEGVQLAITREAFGDVQTMDEEMWQNVKLGLAGGLGFGAVATIYQSIRTDVQNKLTDEQKSLIRQWTGEFMAQGLSKVEAESKAWDKFAETKEGAQVVAEAVQDRITQEKEESKAKFTEMKDAIAEISEKVKEKGVVKETSQRAEDLAWETVVEQQGIPTEAGMPEAGLQPSMIERVPAREVRPAPTAKVVQARLDDYLKLQEYEAKTATNRISEIKELLAKKGRLPKGQGTRAELANEQARLEAQQEVDKMDSVTQLDQAIEKVTSEMGNRSMPYHGGAKNLFPEYTSKQLDEVLKVYQEAKARLEPEAEAMIKAEEIPLFSDARITSKLTNRQIQASLDLFKQALVAKTTAEQRAATIELRKHVLAQRARDSQSRVKELISEGVEPSQAIKQANQEFLSGTLPEVTTDYYSDMTAEMTRVLEAKVYNYWIGKDYFELTSTMTALTNALRGESIPRKKGTGTKYFPKGGSAWDRLARVFGAEPEILEAIDQGRPLPAIIEGIIVESGRESLPLNQETINYLKGLATLTDAQRTVLEKPISELTEADVRIIAQQEYYRRQGELNTLLSEGTITKEEYTLELRIAKDKVYPYKPVSRAVTYPTIPFGQPRLGEEVYVPPKIEPTTAEERARETLGLRLELAGEPKSVAPFEAPISEAFEQLPLLKIAEKKLIVRVLKELAMSPIDIGNFLRANKASFDMSYWRQQKTLTLGHPAAFYRSNIEAWKALFSQKSAEANWEWIKHRPSYPYYANMMARTGHDFLRPLELKKGTSQWKGVEEFGYITGERLIPRITGKIPWVKLSSRAFVTGTNTMNMLVYDKCLEATMRRAEKISTGEIKLKEGEAFDIQQEMDDYAAFITDMTQRASLGKAAPLAPALGAMFFAPRSKLGRLLTPRHLLSRNPRVRALAWKDLSLFVGTFSGLVMLGYWLGLWDVERDPRNAEFMSIRIGNMRIDPWAGYRQFLVLYTRLITGTGVSSVTGQEYEVNPQNALISFFKTSLAPMSSIILDFWTGKNFLGEKVDVKDKRQWLERIAPFSVWDVWEAYEDDWLHGAIAVLPAIFGEGVQTYTGDWVDNWAKLGIPKYLENTPYGINEPVYDLSDFWADTASQLKGVDPATLTESKGFPEYVRNIAEALQVLEITNVLPNQRLTSINADPTKGATFVDYFKMWQDREKIVASGDEEKLKEFDADERTRNAYLGNMTQRQYALLVEYHTLSESQQKEFLAEHPEIYANPREEWLKSHPEENALLALWGKAKIQTLEAYNSTKKLLTDLDIPDSAIPEFTLPPEGSVENYFKYNELAPNSWEAQFILAEDDALREFLDRDEIETPTVLLEKWVANRESFDLYDAYGDKDSKLYIADDDVRAEERQKLIWTSPSAGSAGEMTDFGKVYYEKEGYSAGYSEGNLGKFVEYSALPGWGSWRERFLLDPANADFYKEYTDPNIGDHPLLDESKVKLLERDELYGKFYDEFKAWDETGGMTPDEVEEMHEELRSTRKDDMTFNEAQYRIDAYDIGFPKTLIDDYVEYFTTLPKKPKDYEYEYWFEDDWWLMEHLEFEQAMVQLYKDTDGAAGWKEMHDYSTVPSKKVWELYKTYLGLPRGDARDNFRAQHPELDAWLVLKFGYKPIESRGDKEAPKTKWEEAEEAKRIKEWIEGL